MRNQRKPQSPKVRRSSAHQDAVLDLRKGSRTSPHRSAADYRRKPKHAKKGWEQ